MNQRFAVISDRILGLELECVIPVVGRGETRDVQELLVHLLHNQGMTAMARPYCRSAVPSGVDLCVEHDSSLRGEQRYSGITWGQIEVKTRPLTFRELEQLLPPALEIIRYVGARITPSCGCHVHHDLPEVVERPEVVRNLQHFWWRFHKVIYGLVAPSRASNSFCRPPRPEHATLFDNCRIYEQLCQRLTRCDRYAGLNFTNLTDPNRRTIEWRLHGGTTDWIKIKAWVLATQRWVEHSVARSCHYRPEPVTNSRRGLNALLIVSGLRPNSRVYCKVDKDLRLAGRYLLRRWKHFNQQGASDA
ncbi:MAG: amidoligase family protein [Phycisphaerae bacterium]|nr:amidoligase family protein [Phycisphaerae bacterium]